MIKVLGDFLGVTYRPAGTFDGKVTPERHVVQILEESETKEGAKSQVVRVKTQSAT